MIIREFNAAGITLFREYLVSCRNDPTLPPPSQILEDDRYTVQLVPTREVDFRRLTTKADAATYLKAALADFDDSLLAKNTGLWSWLSLHFFDSVCPLKANKRVVRNDYHYIFEPKNSRHYYRHLLFISWRVLQVSKSHNRLILNSPLATLDKVTAEIMKRLFLTRIPCIFEVLDELYWDKQRGKPRTGIVDFRKVKPGNLNHRFPMHIRQLEKTYDLYSLSAANLIELLGPEFRS